jgi:uncharacterized protein YukE
MHSTADPTHFDALARRVAERADELRDRARTMTAAAGSMRWESLAANAFRDDIAALATALRRSADRFDEVAQALRHQSAGIHRAQAALASAARTLESGAGAVVHVLAGIGG